MFNAFYLWILSLGSLVCALVVCAWVLERLFGLTERVKYLEGERVSHWQRIDKLEGAVLAHKTRLDALEKRPPVVNVVNEIKGAK